MPSSAEEAILTYIDLTEKEWESLANTNLAYNLRLIVPVLVQLDGKLEDLHWFFKQVHEEDLSVYIARYIKFVDLYKDLLVSNIMNERVSYDSLNKELQNNINDLIKLRKALSSLEQTILQRTKAETRQAGFVQNIKPYWPFLDKVWIRVREVIMDSLVKTLNESIQQMKLLCKGVKSAKTGQMYNAVAKLQQVHESLRERLDFKQAEFLDNAIQELKIHLRCAEGLLPGSTVNNSWHVSIDDCPRPLLPKRFTKVTDKFAYCIFSCKEDKKKCPGFESSQGSYIECNQLGMEKTAGAFFREVREADEQLQDQINALALEDPNIQLLKAQAERRDGKYYYAPVLDDNIFVLLNSYPKKTRVGTFDYSVYIINKEPILATDEFLLSADEELLKYIDKGEGMPKEATIKTAAVMRLTFTSNARQDPNFRDYMRKLKAVKITPNTWDVPFGREDDIDHIIAELHDDFGYPIQIFEIVESPEISTDGRRYDLYAMTCVANVKLVGEALPIINRPIPNLAGSDALNDIANMLDNKKPLISHRDERLSTLKTAASNMRVGAQFVIATVEELEETDISIGIRPQIGDRCFVELDNSDIIYAELEEETDNGWIVRDMESGEAIPGEYGPDLFSGEGYMQGPDNNIVIQLGPEVLFSIMQALGLGDPGMMESEEYNEYPENEEQEEPMEYEESSQSEERHIPIEMETQGPPEQVKVPVVQDQEGYIHNKGPGLRILIPEQEKVYESNKK